MGGQIIRLQGGERNPAKHAEGDLRHRLEEIIGKIDEIESQELLAALPECELAQRNHLRALSLLTDAELELRRMWRELAE